MLASSVTLLALLSEWQTVGSCTIRCYEYNGEYTTTMLASSVTLLALLSEWRTVGSCTIQCYNEYEVNEEGGGQVPGGEYDSE